MKVIDREILFQGKVPESIIVRTFEEYKQLGGSRDMLDMYAFAKERAKLEEGKYIDAMDQALSGLPVSDEFLRKQRLVAQACWYLVHLWFHKSLRSVSYRDFDLAEFNKL